MGSSSSADRARAGGPPATEKRTRAVATAHAAHPAREPAGDECISARSSAPRHSLCSPAPVHSSYTCGPPSARAELLSCRQLRKLGKTTIERLPSCRLLRQARHPFTQTPGIASAPAPRAAKEARAGPHRYAPPPLARNGEGLSMWPAAGRHPRCRTPPGQFRAGGSGMTETCRDCGGSAMAKAVPANVLPTRCS